MSRFVEFYERQSFGHRRQHFINPDEVETVSSAGDYGDESLIVMRSGQKVLVSKKMAEVIALLQEEPYDEA